MSENKESILSEAFEATPSRRYRGCEKCNHTGYRVKLIPQEVHQYVVCKSCKGSGRYATAHVFCSGRGCTQCSNVKDHGVKGKMLHKDGSGKVWYRKCKTCEGTGEQYKGAVKRVTKIEIPCMFCAEGTNLGILLDKLDLKTVLVPEGVEIAPVIKTRELVES